MTKQDIAGPGTGKRDYTVYVRLTAGEQRVMQDAARRAGCTMSALIRECVAERWLQEHTSQRRGMTADVDTAETEAPKQRTSYRKPLGYKSGLLNIEAFVIIDPSTDVVVLHETPEKETMLIRGNGKWKIK